jgi:hypothetical protein
MATVIAPLPFRLASPLDAVLPAPAPRSAALGERPRAPASAAGSSLTRRRIEAETVARLVDLSDCRVIGAVGEDAGLVLATALARNVHASGLLRADESGIGAAAPFPGVAARIRTKATDDALPRGADAYLVKRALAARDDAATVRFLASARRAMPRHARLVLLENLVSRESFAAAWFASGAQARSSRTVDDVVALLAAAGLRATQFTAHPAIDLLEAVAA